MFYEMLAAFQHIIQNILLDHSKIKLTDICIHAS